MSIRWLWFTQWRNDGALELGPVVVKGIAARALFLRHVCIIELALGWSLLDAAVYGSVMVLEELVLCRSSLDESGMSASYFARVSLVGVVLISTKGIQADAQRQKRAPIGRGSGGAYHVHRSPWVPTTHLSTHALVWHAGI